MHQIIDTLLEPLASHPLRLSLFSLFRYLAEPLPCTLTHIILILSLRVSQALSLFPILSLSLSHISFILDVKSSRASKLFIVLKKL